LIGQADRRRVNARNQRSGFQKLTRQRKIGEPRFCKLQLAGPFGAWPFLFPSSVGCAPRRRHVDGVSTARTPTFPARCSSDKSRNRATIMHMQYLGLLSAVIAGAIKLLASGWVAILWVVHIPIYPSVLVAHSLIHFFTLRQPFSAYQRRLALTSNVFLVAASAFQIDFGDGSCGYTPMATVLYGFAESCPLQLNSRSCGFML
jgi:hypothetical protein